MEPDEAADLLGDLEQSLSSAALEQMQDSDEVMPLLLHADQTAGGLMTSEYLAFPAAMRADQAIDAVRRWEPKGEESPYLFVVDAGGHLVGVASLFKVLRSAPETRLSALMDQDVVRVYVDDDQEAAARTMGRYDLVVMPVIDHEERLVGVITIDDLVDVLEDEATEDIQRISGSQPLDRPSPGRRYLFGGVEAHRLAPAPVRHRDAHRHGDAALSGSVGGGGGVERVYSAAGGHPAVTPGRRPRPRSFALWPLGDIALRDSLRVLWHEFRTAIVLGLMLSAVAYLRAITWGTTPQVAAVVSLSIIAIVIWADSVGSMLPLLAAKLKMDPALVSGPTHEHAGGRNGPVDLFHHCRRVAAHLAV